MKEKPVVYKFEDGSRIWAHEFETFKVKVYVPVNDFPEKIINYGYDAPYLLVMEENELDYDGAKTYARQSGLEDIAIKNATSVVFVYPTYSEGWVKAGDELWVELISKSKIHEYYEDGYAILNNRFTGNCDGYAIRGAIFRTFLFGCGASADYIAENLLTAINGQGLWGPADVTPTAVVLEKLSVKPNVARSDIPIVSIGNDPENNRVMEGCADHFWEYDSVNLPDAFENIRLYKRWGWEGDLSQDKDLSQIGMMEESCVIEVETSEDNCGDYAKTQKHPLGYIAYYNNDLLLKSEVPLLMCFHGGGDSAKYISKVSEWYKVAKDHDFLLVCVENHLNVTATETMELLDHLCEKYNIDKTRIYASGFSMGGCKSWDLYQEFPESFAALAPMDATFEVGKNAFGKDVVKEINRNVPVPVFYAGGEETPLPELPFQAQKCLDRMAYVFEVNSIAKEYRVSLDNKDNWLNPIWGIDGDRTEKLYDENRKSTLTLQYFDSSDGQCYTVFASISGQGHECRYHTCEHAWRFMSKYRRVDGKIVINE